MTPKMRAHPSLAALAALLLATACAGKSKKAETDTALDESIDDGTARRKGESGVNVEYGATAQDNWKLGEEALADENYLAAQKYFQYIRAKFPYSGLATKADLRVADCLFLRERWLEAIDAYSNFARLHPSHEDAGYAYFKVGESYAQQIPSDWFFLPPSSEKDQGPAKDAARALQSYVDRYPKDKWHVDGVKRLTEVREKLVAHERAVANFYNKIDKQRARAGRLEIIRRDYADVGADDQLLFELVEAWAAVPEKGRAESAFEELGRRFPQSPKTAEARELLSAIPASTSTTTASR